MQAKTKQKLKARLLSLLKGTTILCWESVDGTPVCYAAYYNGKRQW